MNLNLLLGLSGSEKWSTGGITALIGIGMTFAMLILLILFIVLLRYLLIGLDKANPKIKEKLSSIFKKKKDKSTDAVEVATEQQSEEAGDAIDAETLDVIEQSVRKYVSASADDGKPHDRIKILSVKEVKND